jgi:hypothetical protein
MPEERKRMSIEEIEAVLLDLPTEQLDELLDRIVSQRADADDDYNTAELVEARRRSEDMRSGRVKPVPFEQLLDDLDRMAS